MQDTVVLYAAPGMGHVISMVELGKLILHRYPRQFSITILLTTGFMDTPAIISYVHFISQANPSISFIRLPFVSPNPSLTQAAKTFDFLRKNSSSVRQALKEISESRILRAFIIDIFCTTVLEVGKELKIPTYYFFTSGASCLAAFLYLPIIHEQTEESFKDLTTTELHFPGLPLLKATQVPEPILDRADPAYWDFIYFCSHLPRSDGIIVNTFAELEPKAVQDIASGVYVPKSTTPPVFCVGPLIAEDAKQAEKESSGDEAVQVDCLRWLEKQPPRSVVFLCFGSRGSFSVTQIKEIACGLEKSGQKFLWVVKKPPVDEKSKQAEYSADFDVESILPEGFMEKTKDRGLVVKLWAPQVAVLSRESVGGFVTHCGWNSVLESVVAGVPMVAWPLYAEQHLNRNVLVEEMKMAIPVEQREEDWFVSGAEVERRIRELMESEEGKELRERAWKMRGMAMAAKEELGSSTRDLAQLVRAWKD